MRVCERLSHAMPRKSSGAQGTPEEPGSACHAKAAEPKERQRDARGTPGPTSDPLAVEFECVSE